MKLVNEALISSMRLNEKILCFMESLIEKGT